MLYPHQVEGAAWLAPRRRGYLADSPGQGKSRTLLAAVPSKHTATVLCQAIARTHWWREAATLGASLVDVVSYDALVRDSSRLPEADVLILDEAHMLRHADAQRTRLLLGRAGLAKQYERVYLASANPTVKNPFDLWTVLSSLFPDVALRHGLRTAADFKNRFCDVGERRFKVHGRLRRVEHIGASIKNEDEFNAMQREFILRRDDPAGTPEIWWQQVVLNGDELDPDVDVALEMRLEGGADTAACKSARQQVGVAKMHAVAQWLREELEGRHDKVVVFAYHRAVLNYLRDQLMPLGVCYVDGDTSDALRNVMIDWFQTNPEKRIFIGQIDACKQSITLTAASRVVLVEPSWTADDNIQAAHRVARIGQEASHCIAQMVSLAGSVDERIVAQHKAEAELGEKVRL